VLCDPCCGSGTVLAEAVSAGWRAWGADLDADAVELARANAPRARVAVGDAHGLDLAAGEAGACVSNLPFGRRFEVPGDARAWLRATLAEMARVTRPGGRVVVLVPDLPRAAVPDGLNLTDRHRIRLLGTATTIWAFTVSPRRSGPGSPGRPGRARRVPTP
jgi:23S rRNA G2445 N2-methylase RlmL